MYIRKLFVVAFLVGVIFTESKGSDGSGTEDIMKKIDRKIQKWKQEDERKKTPLTLAAFEGNVEKVRSLLAGKANINERDEHGKTALMQAALVTRNSFNAALRKRNQDMVWFLIQAGADVDEEDLVDVFD